MTLLSARSFQPQRRKGIAAPHCTSTMDMTIVLPVKDNQEGVMLFLSEFQRTHPPALYPREIIIVDNNSRLPLLIPREFLEDELSVTVLRCSGQGPACARNLGIQHAGSAWIVFTDSDCIPSSTFLSGYFTAMNGSVGYAGSVKAWRNDRWSQYYESQEILTPPSTYEDRERQPAYVITANALVWKPVLEEIGGFNESIEIAAGEDIDVGFRLREIGTLSYAPAAWVYHNFDGGGLSFIRRFVRYGKGNKIISRLYALDLTPTVFKARHSSVFNWVLARIQYLCLSWGYRSQA